MNNTKGRWFANSISTRKVALLGSSIAASGLLVWALFGLEFKLFDVGLSRLPFVHSAGTEEPIPILRKCGETSEEARALGCRFELHNFAWVPPECYDDQLGDDWDAQSWEFARANRTPAAEDMIPQEVALRGDLHDAWVPWYQHMAHCALIWKKFHRAVALDRPMDSWTHSYAHSEHCADMLINWELAEWRHLFNSHLFLKFPTCGYEWKHQKQEMQETISKKLKHDHGHGEHEH